jgi:hypothetical protein
MSLRYLNSIILPFALLACSSSHSTPADAALNDLAVSADLAGIDGSVPSGLQLIENFCPQGLSNIRCYYDSMHPPDAGLY